MVAMMAQCGATNKNGDPCKRQASKGKRRCKLHGGKSTGPKDQRKNKNAVKAGSLYSQYLSDDDLKNFNQSAGALGQIDTELQLVRMQLARVMRIKHERDQLGDHMQDEETTVDDSRQTTKRKLIDYDGLILRYTARIENLEVKRLGLINQQLDAELKRKELAKDCDADSEPESKRVIFETVDGRVNATTNTTTGGVSQSTD